MENVEKWVRQNKVKRILKSESGQGMAEYGLIIALIAVVVIAAITLIGTNLKDKFGEVANAIGGSGGSQ